MYDQIITHNKKQQMETIFIESNVTYTLERKEKEIHYIASICYEIIKIFKMHKIKYWDKVYHNIDRLKCTYESYCPYVNYRYKTTHISVLVEPLFFCVRSTWNNVICRSSNKCCILDFDNNKIFAITKYYMPNVMDNIKDMLLSNINISISSLPNNMHKIYNNVNKSTFEKAQLKVTECVLNINLVKLVAKWLCIHNEHVNINKLPTTILNIVKEQAISLDIFL